MFVQFWDVGCTPGLQSHPEPLFTIWGLFQDAQVVAVARSAFYRLRLVHQLQPFLNKKAVTMVTHAWVTPWLDDCNVLYMGLLLKMTWKLQLV